MVHKLDYRSRPALRNRPVAFWAMFLLGGLTGVGAAGRVFYLINTAGISWPHPALFLLPCISLLMFGLIFGALQTAWLPKPSHSPVLALVVGLLLPFLGLLLLFLL